jgi:hypothetical protein
LKTGFASFWFVVSRFSLRESLRDGLRLDSIPRTFRQAGLRLIELTLRPGSLWAGSELGETRARRVELLYI